MGVYKIPTGCYIETPGQTIKASADETSVQRHAIHIEIVPTDETNVTELHNKLTIIKKLEKIDETKLDDALAEIDAAQYHRNSCCWRNKLLSLQV